MGWRWFNISTKGIVSQNKLWRLFNCFNRHCDDGSHYWGIGIGQIGNKHLFYIGNAGISLLWVMWRVKQ